MTKGRIVLIGIIAAFATTLVINVYIQNEISTIKTETAAFIASSKIHKDNIAFFGPDPKPFGLTLGDWSVKWWQWVVSVPEEDNPANDYDGKYVQVQPNYPVFFLTGGYNKAVNRTVTVPSDKPIIFPIFNGEYFLAGDASKKVPSLFTEIQVRKFNDVDMSKITFIDATLDGKQLPFYRVPSPLFVQYIPRDNLFDIKLQKPEMRYAVADGYYVFLEPLSIGEHLIHLKGVAPDYSTEVLYHLIVTENEKKGQQQQGQGQEDLRVSAINNLNKGMNTLKNQNVSGGDYYLLEAQYDLMMMSNKNKFTSSNLTAEEHSKHALNFLRGNNVTLSLDHAQDTLNALSGNGKQMTMKGEVMY